MIELTAIQNAKSEIQTLFANQCANGHQNENLLPGQIACGQFLNSLSAQRGIHGSAAALRVLGAGTTPETIRLTRGLLEYCVARLGLGPDTTSDDLASHDRDALNVIKLAEVLYAMSCVPASVAQTDLHITTLATRLQSGTIVSEELGLGWPYLMQSNESSPSLLPTAHAIRALGAHGYDVTAPVDFILNQLISDGRYLTDKSVQVAALFVLTYLPDQPDPIAERLAAPFERLWQQLLPALDQDIESNIEYSDNGHHFYVRVPWQLHLLAAAAKLRPFRAFSSQAAQARLEAILAAVARPERFLYPHSGSRVSSRTNAILFDTLCLLQPSIQSPHPLSQLSNVIDGARGILASRSARVLLSLGVTGIAGVSVIEYLSTNTKSLADLAPNFLSAVLLSAVLAGKRRF